jgi:hypothetical protein
MTLAGAAGGGYPDRLLILAAARFIASAAGAGVLDDGAFVRSACQRKSWYEHARMRAIFGMA